MEQYTLSIVGLLALCLISLVLAVYSGRSKGAARALAGPVLDARDDNRLYRIDRVHMNSVEALTPFAIPVVLAMLLGMEPVLLAVLVWLHLVLRLIHLAVYLRGGEAAKGGKLRTVLYVSSALVTLVLILVTAWTAVT
ncbi:MAPEG family protein [Devosia sp. Root635]|uniref:MAPEG family protein n=1 Tax=Devosia sp. Root635 TaxID=1736575 RepID=UPI000701BD3D|nr:MAPEG family protein [Devosia sp. Root635]KRA44726.1 MAPEG family protein [Devosia sp. Root635]